MNPRGTNHLGFEQWQVFSYQELFTIKKGRRLTKAEMATGTTPFIGAADSNNGITAYIDLPAEHPGNTITVPYNGNGVAEAFYQPHPFCATDDVNVLYPKFEMDVFIALFICTVIRAEKYRFSYGRKWHKERMLQSTISLPTAGSGILALAAMREYMYRLNGNRRFADIVDVWEKPQRNDVHAVMEAFKWGYFDLTELFEISGTKTTPKLVLESHGPGSFPYVTTQAENNGIEGYYNYFTEQGGVLTVDSAVIGYCSYQQKPFSASDHVEKLEPRFEMDVEIAMFLVAIINAEQYRYNYGRKASQDRLKSVAIKLPATRDHTPDWEGIRTFIQALPYSASLKMHNVAEQAQLNAAL